jgi:pSer/pThr/pTyr-binding forkhead associated (FHA) protein
MPEHFSWNDLGDDLPYEGTRLESVEDIRAAGAPAPQPNMGGGGAVPPPRTPTMKEAVPPSPSPAPAATEATPFRPVMRPPMAVLCVLDDGRSDGDTIRIRTDTFTIGRVEGDLKIPHDRLISGKHVSITREADKGRFRWFINDLQTRNGTFIRASTAVLLHEQEVLIGGRRFIFNAAQQGQALLQGGAEGNETKGWSVVKPTDLIPSLTEVLPDGSDGQRFFLDSETAEIGRDKSCHVHLDDPMVNPKHAKLLKNEKGEWEIHNLNTVNGTWIRKNRMVVAQLGQFQIGEQRFLLKVM